MVGMKLAVELGSTHFTNERNSDIPFKKSASAIKVATPLRFGVPSLEIQFADIKIVSVPAERGGCT